MSWLWPGHICASGIKAEGRLPRGLDDGDFTEGVNDEICRLAAPEVTHDMGRAVDPEDLKKRLNHGLTFFLFPAKSPPYTDLANKTEKRISG
jgi:hypothetical protein